MPVECSFNAASAVMPLGGVALGAVVGFWSARIISDRNVKATAAAKLRASFAPALAQIEIDRQYKSTHDRPDVTGFFKTALLQHAGAVEEFRPFVAAAARAQYQQAWERYYRSVRDQTVDAWDPATTGEKEHEWHVVAKNINALLAHAEP